MVSLPAKPGSMSNGSSGSGSATSIAPTTPPTHAPTTENDVEPRTVFDDPVHFTLKHPLASTWDLYADVSQTAARRSTSAHWGQTMERLAAVDSIEGFMGLYHNTPLPSQLGPKATLYLFRQGIRPAWEDPGNAGGGSWSVQFPRDKYSNKIDDLWLNTMLGAIGEMLDLPYPPGTRPIPSLDEPSVVSGVALAARPAFYRVSIWTRAPKDAVPDAKDETHRIGLRTYDVGMQFKTNILGFKLGDKLGGAFGSEVEFQSHEDAGAGKKARRPKVSL